jgi:DNA (cytosine-5)-methyltransferase 1
VDSRRLPVPSADYFSPPANVVPITVETALVGIPRDVELPLNEGETVSVQVGELPGGTYFDRVRGCIPNGVGHKDAIKRYRISRVVNGHAGTRHAKEIEQRYGALRPGEVDPISRSARLALSGFCPTLRAGTGADRGSHQAVRPIHPEMARVITPREAARLQGFPDWFELPPTKWHSFRQIGNSVSPIVAEGVLRQVHAHLERYSRTREN